ncbi:peptidoglycan recognition protein family protein [Thalassobacillus hwangdonensis]|uniref:N-acetylmuramoyl-L-alanine amidase n=1 Tax=Thalassobacillus hwangdonensis TaxID=546108 RepID=A0ABW3KYP4_9BACI
MKQHILPVGHPSRPGIAMNARYITVHTTGNEAEGADAQAHSDYLLRLQDGSRIVSWHFTVDEKEVIQHLPENEIGWHAGDGRGHGNLNSIGIEICENKDGDFENAVTRAVRLIRTLMARYGIPLQNVVPHRHWSGKRCPRRLLNDWEGFMNKVEGDKERSIYEGMSVTSIYDGKLRFYNKPSWEDKDVFGYVTLGQGFPTVKRKRKVGSGYQLEVLNSKGEVYYITAHPSYVTIE